MENYSVLVVDDEAGIRQSLTDVLQDEGYRVTAVESGEACLDFLARERPTSSCWTSGFRASTGWKHWPEFARVKPRSPVVVMISGHGTIETAVRATKKGAFDFIEKPLSIEKTLLTLKHATEELTLADQNRQLAGNWRATTALSGRASP